MKTKEDQNKMKEDIKNYYSIGRILATPKISKKGGLNLVIKIFNKII